MPITAAGLAQRYRRIADLYLLLVLLGTLGLGLVFTRVETSWTLGDWLVNYHGGFVRRGLTGQLVLALAHHLHVSPVYPAFAIPAACCVVTLFSAHWLLVGSRWQAWSVLTVVSPATFAFALIDVRAGYHKEVLFFAGMALLLLLLARTWKPIAKPVVSALLCVFAAVAILSHEPAFCYVPYLGAALAIAGWSAREVAFFGAAPLGVATACLLTVSRHPGSRAVVAGICRSLGGPEGGLCGGAIAVLDVPPSWARGEVQRFVSMYGYWHLYPVLALLALFPVALGFRQLWRERTMRPQLRALGGAAALSFVASIELFVYAVDWGRWIQIHVFCLSMLLLFLDRTAKRHNAPEPFRAARGLRGALQWTGVAAYALCWSIPHYGNRPLFGWLGLPARVLRLRTMQ